MAGRIAVMSRGRLYAAGPPAEVIDEDMLRDVFGVQARLDWREGRLFLRVDGPAEPVRAL